MRLHQQLPLWVLAALGIPGVVSSQEIPLAVEAVLDRATIRDINWGYLIESADGNVEYYGRNADFAMVPASNTKIFTTAAGFGLLGETYAFRTRAFHTGTRNGATVTGDIILLGEHDITWHSDIFGSGNAARGLRTLAQKVRAAGITQINGAVIGQGAMIYNKSSTGTDHSSLTSTQNRNAEAAAAFRSELVAAGVTVINGSSGATGFNPPAGSTLIATYLSTENNDVETGRPLDLAEACIALNKGSHNGMADYLMRHIGYKITGVDTYQAGAQQSIAWFNTSLDVNTTGMILNDGSGLDRTNKVTPKQTVDVFREMTLRSPRWVATFPIGGVDGTLGGRLASIRGQVIAKTGTLPSSGSVSLSGFHNHPITGERYFFSIYANTDGILTGGTQAIDATTTRQAMDDSLVAFAGQRPAFAPDLLLTRTASDGTIRLEWNDPGFTTASYDVLQAAPGEALSSVLAVTPTYVIEAGSSLNTLGQNRADYSETGTFQNSTAESVAPGLTPGIGSRFIARASATGSARFRPSQLPAGRYRVDLTTSNFESSDAHNVSVTISEQGPSGTVTRNFRMEISEETAGNHWRTVGTLNFIPGNNHGVEFSNSTQTSTGADDRLNIVAVRFTPLFANVPPNGSPGLLTHAVSVVSPRGTKSKTSEVFPSRKTPWGQTRALVIDGFDRWNTFSLNPNRQSHRMTSILAESLPLAFDVECVANEWIENGTVQLTDFDHLFWVLGDESTADETFSATEQSLVTSYIAQGGNLFVSGSEVAWDLDRATGPLAADRTFLNTTLRADFPSDADDDANTYQVAAAPAGIFSGLANFSFDNGTGGLYDVRFPDVLSATNGSSSALTYVGGRGGNAALSHSGASGAGNLIYLGFPFESITSKSVRDEILLRTTTFFGVQIAPATSLWFTF